MPTLRRRGLRGGVTYFDGQFDDARLVVNLVQTAAEQGAVVLNYARVTGVTKTACRRRSTASWLSTSRPDASCGCRRASIINATGPFADGVRHLALPGARPLIAPSQGIHLVFDRSFLPGRAASWCRRHRMAA